MCHSGRQRYHLVIHSLNRQTRHYRQLSLLDIDNRSQLGLMLAQNKRNLKFSPRSAEQLDAIRSATAAIFFFTEMLMSASSL